MDKRKVLLLINIELKKDIVWGGSSVQHTTAQHSSIVSEQKLKLNQFKLKLFRSKLTHFALFLSLFQKEKRQTTYKKIISEQKFCSETMGEFSLIVYIKWCHVTKAEGNLIKFKAIVTPKNYNIWLPLDVVGSYTVFRQTLLLRKSQ